MKPKTFFMSSLPVLIASGILIGGMFAGCKKKEQRTYQSDNPAPVEQKQEAPKDDDSDSVWSITTSYGTFDGHRVDVNNGILEFVSSDGYKVYVSSPWLIKIK